MADNATRDITAFLRQRVVPPGGSRHGLVVGIEQYRDARLNLRCAAADAKAIFDLMTDPDCGMFPKDNVRLLLNEEATREGIWRALSALRRSAGENDTVWVYYAGHAAPEESSLYWVTHDADVDDLYGTGLSNDQISKVLEDIRAKRLLVLLDCCHAAATAAQKNPTRAVLTADEVFSCYKGHGRITLSSSDGKEKSVELGDVGHGAFTYFLEQGLRGEADSDGDGVVTADELWRYLRSKVADASHKAGNAQTPVLLGEMRHDFALSLNPISVGQKKKLASLVTSLIGLGADQLTTEEAGVCLEILKRPPRTPQEEALVQELLKGLGDEPNVRLIKILSDTAKHSIPAGKPPAEYEPPAEYGASRPAQKDETVEDHKAPLIKAYLSKLASSDWEVQVEGAEALRKMGSNARPVLSQLSAYLADDDDDVRGAVRQAINAIGLSDDVLSGVRKALASDDWNIRVETAEFLGKHGPSAKCALPDLLKLFSDEDSDVREAAEAAADRIRGVSRQPAHARPARSQSTSTGSVARSNVGKYLLAALLVAGALGGIAFGIFKLVQYKQGIEAQIKAEENAMNAKAEASPGKLLTILQDRNVEQLAIAPLEQYPKRGIFSTGLTEEGAAGMRQNVLSVFQPVMAEAGIPCFYSESRPQGHGTTAILTFTVGMSSGKLHGRDGQFIELHFEARMEDTSEVIWIDSWKFWKGRGG